MSKKDEVVIRVSNVAKDFYLPHEKSNSIKTKIVRMFDKKQKGGDTQHALKDISFEVKKGEFFGIVGRNGSGKSTLLKIISQIYKPTKGSVTVNGRLVPFIELGVGFNPELTGRENVFLNGALLGFTRKEIEEQYDDIVAFAELEDFMDQKLKNYSSGMQVRLAFSVAIRADADILVLDEVLAVGDADFQRKCYTYFHSLKKNKKTVILVTHDMNAVKEYCDRAILINEGIIDSEGDTDKVARDYLRLFNKSEDVTEESDDTEKRWGSGEIKLIDKTVTIGDTLRASFTIESSIATEGVVVGFRFYNEVGDILAGASTTNAENGHLKGIAFKKGEVKKIIFEGDNILGTGNYRIGYTIRLTDMVTIFDDDEYAVEISHSVSEGYQPIIYPMKLEVLDV